MQKVQERYMQSICSSHPSEDILYHLGELKKVYTVERLTLSRKQQLMNQLKHGAFAEETFTFLMDPIHPEGVQGLIVNSLGVGFVDQSLFNELHSAIPCQTAELEWRKGKSLDDESIDLFLAEKKFCMDQASEKLFKAREYLDFIKQIYQASINQEALNLLLKDIVYELFSIKDVKLQACQGVAISYFGSNNRARYQHMFQWSRESIQRYIILKGFSGTGKTKILKALAVLAIAARLSVELYRCPFYPESLDAVVIPELKTAIIDGSEPHSIEPVHPNDRHYVLEEQCVNEETLYSFAMELKEANMHYKKYMHDAQFFLQEAKNMHEQAEYILNRSQRTWLDQVIEDWEKLVGDIEK
ncbi:hypothetical protein GCM10011391_17830 [Pullulanibacillus camelliae]|uniref:Uncharacterized protein n=1 Tax=Pullulanibacillus camelliae TaxID=1707096 RepID=A0A8J2VRP4_9BACL|nr:hypothetical protein [Pullulanibacillus camelliae]GGE39464.1 hypothetical protein GCM10011391_17830 [Pullulanibacillus camelliae]